MIAWIWGAITLAGAVILAAVGDLVSDEIRGWLDLAPRAILRLAATQLDVTQRETIYQDEWLPELTYALRGAEARPITRLITGIRYATGILISARRVAGHLNRTRRSEQYTQMEIFLPHTANTQALGKLLSESIISSKSLTIEIAPSSESEIASIRELAQVVDQLGLQVKMVGPNLIMGKR